MKKNQNERTEQNKNKRTDSEDNANKIKTFVLVRMQIKKTETFQKYIPVASLIIYESEYKTKHYWIILVSYSDGARKKIMSEFIRPFLLDNDWKQSSKKKKCKIRNTNKQQN